MKSGNLKWLKILGIIFIVAALLALGVWGIIALLNKEKVYINAFASETQKEIDTKFEAFEKIQTKDATLYAEVCDLYLTQRTCENENLTQNINLIKNYFSVIGLNSSERKSVDNIVSNLTKYRDSLSSIYLEIDSIASKSPLTSEDKTNFKNLVIESYAVNLDLIIGEKYKLFELLLNSLDNHKIEQSSYVKSLQSLSKTAYSISTNFSLKHIKTYGKLESSSTYCYSLYTPLNSAIKALNEHSKTYNNVDLATLIQNLEKETLEFNKKVDEFFKAYNNLTTLEIKTLSKDGEGFDYTITPETVNLTIVVDFLKTDGLFSNLVKSDSEVIKGINL